MTVTIDQVEYDIGELYDSVDNESTAVESIITRAEAFVTAVTGTATGYDVITRPLADAMVVNQMMGSVDSVNKTIGSLSVGTKDLKSMQNFFMNEAKKAAIIKGFSLDGLSILFQDSEA